MTNTLNKIMHNGDEYMFPTGMPEWWTAGQMLAMSSNWPVWVDVASPTSITLNQSSITLSVGDTYQLTATISPSSAIITQITWTSSDETVATVSSTWLVSYIASWNATITATTFNWLTATCGVAEATWQWDMDNWALAQTSNVLWWQWRWWVFFNPDGTKMYLSHGWGKKVYECTLNTAYDVSGSIDLSKYASVEYIQRWPEDLHFSTDGTKMFTLNEDWSWVTLLRYSLATAWDISNITQDQTLSWVWGNNWRWLYITPDWLTIYISEHDTGTLNVIELGTAWDLATAWTPTTVSTSIWWLSIWFWDSWNFLAWQYWEQTSNMNYAILGTAYSESSATDTGTKSIWTCRAWWLWFNDIGTICVMVWGWGGSNYVTKYTL